MTGFAPNSTSTRVKTIGSLRIALFSTMVVIAGATGCALAPYDGEHIGPTTTFVVQGVASTASTQITVEAFNQATGV
jgi:hypothetical protein